MKYLPLTLAVLLVGCSKAPDFNTSELQPGGSLTAKRLSERSYIYPGKGITKAQELDFWTGFSLFRDPWVIAPSSTKDRDGLGPLFNARSCVACHDAGGRAKTHEAGEFLPLPLIIRLGSTDKNIMDVDPIYGGQLQPRTIDYDRARLPEKIKPEAWLKLDFTEVKGKFADGTSYQLHRPNYELTKLGYGELATHTGLSPRHAPNVFGMGMLDAISDSDLLAQEDVNDSNNDGISAKYNRVPNVVTGATEIGRFGFKAKHPNMDQQVAGAFRGDIGITSSLFPTEDCTETQISCAVASMLGGHDSVEIPDKLLQLVNDFNRFLAVPPTRRLQDKLAGRALFYQLDCHLCHTPSYQTDDNYSVKELAGQTIWPYTDLALHDMGEGLADGVYEFSANGREWRTPPLWGIGLQKAYTGQARYLHDGRARSIEEAILWHGGEAQKSQTAYINLSKEQRTQLLTFLAAI